MNEPKLDAAAAAHLLRRIAWAPRPGEVDRAIADGPRATVRRLLGGPSPAPVPAAETIERALHQSNDRTVLAGLLLHRAAATTEPARERLVHFWHNHFVSALSKVREGRMMLGQFTLFRELGTGSFRQLTRAVSRDPAMVRYLDSERSTRAAPNENFARELLELFTTGPGPYTEDDIKEAARAFTGYHIRAGRFHFSRASHDNGTKTVMGRSGPLTGDDVVDHCVSHVATATFMANKLARAFVSDAPRAPIVASIANSWTRHGGNLARVLEDLCADPMFYADENRYALTRSPADLVLATLRVTGTRFAPRKLAEATESMGQTLVDPPTVKGYDGGKAWLNPATLLARRAFLVSAGLKTDRKLQMKPTDLPVRVLGRKLEGDARSRFERLARTDGDRALAAILCHPDFQRS